MADWPLFGDGVEVLSYGEDTATSLGTLITADSTANSMGGWSVLDASTANAINGAMLTISSAVVSQDTDFLINIGIGGSGVEEIVIETILFSVGLTSDVYHTQNLYLPINIPQGSRLVAQIQASTLSETLRVSLTAAATSFRTPSMHQSSVTIGANTGDSGGTQVDPGSTINTKGAWQVFSTSTAIDLHGLMVSIGLMTNTAQRSGSFLMDIGIGGSGLEEVIVSNIPFRVSPNEYSINASGSWPVMIPAGTRLSIRVQCSHNNAVDRLLDYVIHGFI